MYVPKQLFLVVIVPYADGPYKKTDSSNTREGEHLLLASPSDWQVALFIYMSNYSNTEILLIGTKCPYFAPFAFISFRFFSEASLIAQVNS
jgi:hypothetical protein